MYRKPLWILTFLAFVSIEVHSQDYYTWYQGGLTTKVVSARMAIDSELVSSSEGEPEIGYQLGAFYRININNIYFEPQLLFSAVKSQLVFKDFGGVPSFDPVASFEFNTLELPVDIGVRIGNLRLNTGPSLSVLLSGKRSFLNEVDRVTEDYNNVNMLWHFGVGGDFDRVMVDLKYEFGLSKTGESLSNILGTDIIPRQRQWVFSVGFNFLNDF